MKIISFARTTAALVARRKSVTRREWTDRHAAGFKVGDLAQAWSASPHRKGKKVGIIRITALYKEATCLIPDSDWEAEGFEYMQEHGIDLGKDLSCPRLWQLWKEDQTGFATWVIRFEVVSIEPGITPEQFWPEAA